MKIAFDIDDTIADTIGPTIKSFNKLFNTAFNKDDFKTNLQKLNYHYKDDPIAVVYNLTDDEVKKIHRQYAFSVLTECLPFKEALQTIHNYKNKGEQIYYITARSAYLYDFTYDWLNKHGFPKGILIHEENDKSKLAVELGIDKFYEDNINNALKIANKGIETLLVNSITNYHEVPNNIKRIDWNQYVLL